MTNTKQDSPVYTEGICGDGAMILRDGQPFPISSAIDALNAYTSTEALNAPDRNFENAREAWNLVWEREAELSKLKSSTEALRRALAEPAGEARFLLNRISELSFDDMSDLIRDFNGHVEPPMSRVSKMLDAIEARAALSGSPDNDRHHSENDNARLRDALTEARRMCWTAVRLGIDDPTFDPDKHALIQKIDAALSGSPAPSTEGLREWRDIKTAPKDGTEILTFSDRMGLGTMVLYWADGYWREKANGLGLKYGPTHWMPLPPAPDAARTALAGVTAPTTRSFNEHMVEDLIVAAYKRGFIWANHNPVDGEFLDKAARDYADYTMNAPSAGVTAPSEVDGK